MKKIHAIWAVLILCMLVAAFTALNGESAEARQEIETMILKSYINGAFNDLDPEAMRSGFHQDFAIFSPKGEELAKYPIKTWADGVAKTKGSPDFDPAKNRWEHKFAYIDVTGDAAAAKIELYKDGKHIFTDYLSLLKFDSGWKIVAKVYHRHS